LLFPCFAHLVQGYLRTNKVLRIDQDPGAAFDLLTNGILRLLEGEGAQVEEIKVRQLGGEKWMA
jgi:hypothetical protein